MHDDQAVQTSEQEVAVGRNRRITGEESVNAHALFGSKRADCKAVELDARQSAVGAGPNVAVEVLQQGVDAVLWQPVSLREPPENRTAARVVRLLYLDAAAKRRHPELALAIDQH